MKFPRPPGMAGDIVSELAEMVIAPREALVMGAYLTLASTLYGRRYKDGHDPINLFMATAAPEFAGKSRMVAALTTAMHSAIVGWDADPADMSGRVTANGIHARPRLFSETPYATAPQVHSELVRTGSQCFVVDEFRSTLQAMVSNKPLADYLTRAWGAGMATRPLAQLDRKTGTVGDGGGAVEVHNPNLTIWGLCAPFDLPDVETPFWSRWLILRDDTVPTMADVVRAPWTCRVAFSTETASWLRHSVKGADDVDAAYAVAAIQDPEGKRGPVMMPEALAMLQRERVISLDWEDAALGALSGLTGREMTLARRVACLLTATNGMSVVVRAETAEWAVAFIRRCGRKRTAPKPMVLTQEGVIAAQWIKANMIDQMYSGVSVVQRIEAHIATALKFKGVGVPRRAAASAIAELIGHGAVWLDDRGTGGIWFLVKLDHPLWQCQLTA